MFAGRVGKHVSSMQTAFEGLDSNADGVLSAKEQAAIRTLLHQDL